MVDSYGAAWVFDELHAYERERLGMILAMIEHARTVYDVRCLALSATMPTVLIDAFSRTVGGAAVLRADDETFARFARHRVQIDERSMDDEAVFDEVERRYRDGECILVVHNTVRAAMACFDHMRARVDHDDVLLLHSRFTADDRAGLERSLIERTATGRREGRRPCVVVATQTVEVSLDVDFDRLWTAPAPIEALVQRFGRCNRGRRAPTMDVHISAVIDDGTQAVYDFEIVRRTVELLRTMHGCTLDEGQVQRLVDELYEPVRERWMKDVKAATERFRRDVLETNRPLTTHDELVSLFDALFDGVEVVPEMMKDELERRSRDEPVRVRGLGVPISRQRYASLKRSGKVQRHRESKQWLVSLPYDPVRGLAEDWR
jgi:CRISPR-associated endonuclease/helicase Cas3